MKVSGPPLPIEIVLQVVLFSGALAHAGYIAVLVDIPGHGNPSLARSRPIRACVEPAVLDSRYHRKAEHGRA